MLVDQEACNSRAGTGGREDDLSLDVRRVRGRGGLEFRRLGVVLLELFVKVFDLLGTANATNGQNNVNTKRVNRSEGLHEMLPLVTFFQRS